jgi:hypothetical protein
MSERIAALARRVEDDPSFLAAPLKEYVVSEGIDDAELARLLRCSTDRLAPLRLCRRPRSETPWFRQDVERIAARFGLDAGALAQIVRRAEVLVTLRVAEVGDRGTLMAARDRTDKSDDGPPEEGQT